MRKLNDYLYTPLGKALILDTDDDCRHSTDARRRARVRSRFVHIKRGLVRKLI